MKKTEILLQGEGIADIELVELDAEAGAAGVLAAARGLRRSEQPGEYLLFLEDEDTPLEADGKLPKPKAGEPLRLHVHRCGRIAVAVTFNGETQTDDVGPGRTVAAVKKWAAQAFDMDPKDAAEHALQIAGGVERPEPDTHLGALAVAGTCAVRFDLVPLKRVEG